MLRPEYTLIRDIESDIPEKYFDADDILKMAQSIIESKEKLFTLVAQDIQGTRFKSRLIVGHFEYWAYMKYIELSGEDINTAKVFCFKLPCNHRFSHSLNTQIKLIKKQKPFYLN